MSTIKESFPKPTIKEAVLDPDSSGYCIYYDQLGPEGATLVVSYSGRAVGQKVQALEQGAGSNPCFDEEQTVGSGSSPLVFRVPKSCFSSPRLIQFQYFVSDGGGGHFGASDHALYMIK